MATPTPRPHAPAEVFNAVQRAGFAVDSLFALTDLMMIQSAAANEGLSHVNRQALAGLVSIVASEIERELKAAEQHYEVGKQVSHLCQGGLQ